MNMKSNLIRGCLLAGSLWALGLGHAALAQEEERVSRFNEYRGYSAPIYDGQQRSSVYITARDGTRLAADIIRPSQDGQVVETPLPVIWQHTRYLRSRMGTNEVESWVEPIVQYGYVVAAVDVRGSGASFGARDAWFTAEENSDGYDVTEWLAAQPWSNGNIGMFSRSYLGVTQFMAASQVPPHLKAIFPEMVTFDMYDWLYPGGIFQSGFLSMFSRGVKMMDMAIRLPDMSGKLTATQPVDADLDSALLHQAVREHRGNASAFHKVSNMPYRDSPDGPGGERVHLARSPNSYLGEIGNSGVAVYVLAGWLDMFSRDAFLWLRNLKNPVKLTVGPWYHGEVQEIDMLAEHLRWFDHWLKGVDNGVMDEPVLTYWTLGAADGDKWRTAATWPLPGQSLEDYYFAPGPTGTVASANDGSLSAQAPIEAGHGDGQDDLSVDYGATVSGDSRWGNSMAIRTCAFEACGDSAGLPDLAANDARGLTYTSEPLAADLEVTGHPVARLWVTSSDDDGDFFVYLEEVEPDGRSQYVTEGMLRASNRALHEPAWDTFGLPWHRGNAGDRVSLPAGEPVELVIDLQPTSNIFDAGNRIRVTVTTADEANFSTRTRFFAPTVSLHRRAGELSRITLPVIRRDETPPEKVGSERP